MTTFPPHTYTLCSVFSSSHFEIFLLSRVRAHEIQLSALRRLRFPNVPILCDNDISHPADFWATRVALKETSERGTSLQHAYEFKPVTLSRVL